jgi:hypothetical protein
MSESSDELPFCPCCRKPWPAWVTKRPTWDDLGRAVAQANLELGAETPTFELMKRVGELMGLPQKPAETT